MKLKTFKTKNELTTQDIASMFGTKHQNVTYWLNVDAEIIGKPGQRRIELHKVVAEEGK